MWFVLCVDRRTSLFSDKGKACFCAAFAAHPNLLAYLATRWGNLYKPYKPYTTRHTNRCENIHKPYKPYGKRKSQKVIVSP